MKRNLITSVLARAYYPILSRVIAAIVGGYLLANITAILLSYLLPGSQANNVMTGMLLSFIIYMIVVIWVFAVKTVWRAWQGIFVPGFIGAISIWFLIPKGLL